MSVMDNCAKDIVALYDLPITVTANLLTICQRGSLAQVNLGAPNQRGSLALVNLGAPKQRGKALVIFLTFALPIRAYRANTSVLLCELIMCQSLVYNFTTIHLLKLFHLILHGTL